MLHETGIRELRRKPVFTTPNVFPPEGVIAHGVVGDDTDEREALEPQHCYVCKQTYTRIHHFYDQLCPTCGEFNFTKRIETADLRGRVALLTGARVKIGYQAGLKLLRAGAHVSSSPRAFPRDAAAALRRKKPDFARVERPAGDLRPRPAAHAQRRGVLPRNC